MGKEKTVVGSEKLLEVVEMRALLHFLSQRAKDDIIKGIAMFEAGYRIGYLDGINSLNDKNHFRIKGEEIFP